MMSLTDISLIRGGKRTLHDLELEIADGEVHAIFGWGLCPVLRAYISREESHG
ncbi:MAG: hypothetical protein H6Q84_3125 [Deltaproteobacteria bacterium]|nr:hypothetical protein [Deltaproteobacteria bacterium]